MLSHRVSGTNNKSSGLAKQAFQLSRLTQHRVVAVAIHG